jgi:hypothetical protein
MATGVQQQQFNVLLGLFGMVLHVIRQELIVLQDLLGMEQLVSITAS